MSNKDDRSFTHAHTPLRQHWRKIARSWGLTLEGETLRPRTSRHELMELADVDVDDLPLSYDNEHVDNHTLSITDDGYVIEITNGCCHIAAA